MDTINKIIQTWFLFTLLLILPATSTHAGSEGCSSYTLESLQISIKPERKIIIDEENKKLASITAETLSGVVLINIFKGYFPLPSRFSLISGIAHDDKMVHFVSPPLLSRNKKELLKSLNGLSGSAYAGKYQDYLEERKRNNLAMPPSKTRTVFECVAGHLKVELNMNPDFPDLLNIFIHTDKEYVMLTDENPYLWKYLLDIYLTTIK